MATKLSCQTILIKSSKSVKLSKVTNMCKPIFVTFGLIGTWPRPFVVVVTQVVVHSQGEVQQQVPGVPWDGSGVVLLDVHKKLELIQRSVYEGQCSNHYFLNN
jgi:hypothetical protein